jgi:hypothetical protein
MPGYSKESAEVLLAAIADEPPPEHARHDPALLAEHRAARADIAVLREQLALLGGELTRGPAPAPAPALAPPPAPALVSPALRRRRTLLAVAAGAAVLLGSALWLGPLRDDGQREDMVGGAGPGESAALTPEGFINCSQLIMEGTVLSVEPVPGAERDTITMAVDTWYKPAEGEAEVSFPMDWNVDPRLQVGDYTLISIPKGGDGTPDNWSTGNQIPELRQMIVQALPGADDNSCETGPQPNW